MKLFAQSCLAQRAIGLALFLALISLPTFADGFLDVGDLREAARSHVLGESWVRSADGLVDVEAVRIVVEHDTTFVHFKLFYNGRHVQRAGLYLVSDAQTFEVLSVERELTSFQGVALHPDLSAEEAINRIAGEPWTLEGSPELVYFVADNGTPRLAWQATGNRTSDNDRTVTERIHIDAVEGTILHRHEGIHDQEDNSAIVKAAPAAPTLSIESLHCYGSNLLSWNAVAGATKYKVFYASVKNTSYATLYTTVKYKTYSSANVGPLQSPLYFWVKACNSSNQCSNFSNAVKATYTPGCA